MAFKLVARKLGRLARADLSLLAVAIGFYDYASSLFGEADDEWDCAYCSHEAGLLLRETQPEEAKRRFDYAMAIYRKTTSSESERHYNVNLGYRGATLKMLGRLDDALSDMRASLAFIEKLDDQDYLSVRRFLLHHMGATYRQQGLYAKALETFERELLLVDDRSSVSAAWCLSSMAEIFLDQRRVDTAHKACTEALSIYEARNVDGDEDKFDKRTFCISLLGRIYLTEGRLDEALKENERALANYRRYYGDNGERVAYALRNVAETNLWRNEFDKAWRTFRASMTMYEHCCGVDSRRTCRAVLELADCIIIGDVVGERDAVRQALARLADVDRMLIVNGLACSTSHQIVFGLSLHHKLCTLRARLSTSATEAGNIWLDEVTLLLTNGDGDDVVRAVASDCLARAASLFDAPMAMTTTTSTHISNLSPAGASSCVGEIERFLLLDSAFTTSSVASLSWQSRMVDVDDDIVADMAFVHATVYGLRALVARDLSKTRAAETSMSSVRNAVAEVCILLNGVLDKSYTRWKSAVQSRPAVGIDRNYFPCDFGSRENFNDELRFAAAHGRDDAAALSIDTVIDALRAVQPFSTKLARSPSAGMRCGWNRQEDDWLATLVDLANGNKHIELARHVHSATLKDKSKGLVEVKPGLLLGLFVCFFSGRP